jgi:hypothetical protein
MQDLNFSIPIFSNKLWAVEYFPREKLQSLQISRKYVFADRNYGIIHSDRMLYKLHQHGDYSLQVG